MKTRTFPGFGDGPDFVSNYDLNIRTDALTNYHSTSNNLVGGLTDPTNLTQLTTETERALARAMVVDSVIAIVINPFHIILDGAQGIGYFAKLGSTTPGETPEDVTISPDYAFYLVLAGDFHQDTAEHIGEEIEGIVEAIFSEDKTPDENEAAYQTRVLNYLKSLNAIAA